VKKITMLLLSLLFTAILLAPTPGPLFYITMPEPLDPHALLWYAVRMVESRNSEDAINHAEKAYGIAQIRQVKLNEYYRVTGIRYTLKQCLNEEVSREIFYWHCDKWGSYELAAKRWNGSGPMTITYWNKVKKYL